jgi:undecaprenyl-diphosphatase
MLSHFGAENSRIKYRAGLRLLTKSFSLPAGLRAGMEYLHIIVLAVVQGLTEFLPVSSKGHLGLTGALLSGGAAKDEAAQLAVIVLLHLGTLLALLVVYWQRIWRLLGADRSLLVKLCLGTVPGGLAGLTVKKFCPGLEGHLLLTGTMFLGTAMLLLASRRYLDGTTPYEQVTYRQALLVGCAQAFAVLPGMSRSGTTIVAGLVVGLRRDAAATFSFLLSIPIIAAACLLEGTELLTKSVPGVSLGPILVGVVVSFVVGLASLLWLLRWLARGRLHYFAWYLIPLGCAVIAWQWLR